MAHLSFLALVSLLFAFVAKRDVVSSAEPPAITFDVRPILQSRCVKCHEEIAEGRPRPRTPAGVLKGGEPARPSSPGKPDEEPALREGPRRRDAAGEEGPPHDRRGGNDPPLDRAGRQAAWR